MNIETFKVFQDLVELRSFSKVAEKNCITQSAVSQQLAQLEMMHKCQLVSRKKRPIELTREGQVLYKACKEILERYEHFKNELNSVKTTSENRINIGAIFSIGMHTLPNYIKKFMVKYPKIHIHVEYLSAARIYDRVLKGDLDIGLVAVPQRDKRLKVFDFEHEPLMFVCSPKHSFAKKSQIDIHTIQFESFIAFDKGVPTRGWIDNILERYNIVIEPISEFDNIETVKRAVEINSGISILPETAIAQETADGTIKAVPFSNERFVRPTGIIMRKNKIFTKSGLAFIKLLQKKES
ncbi:MAG: LysR family transcriptional regulator [Planctomycetota bacterium]|jgi:DNA-binding transcriptional LysR family regulator